jgi:inorganic phosphate transporter, PiT family
MFDDLTVTTGFFLIAALGLALAFEFVNGFHDTANAVATVIYTHTLRPTYAVIWSGSWNFLGVLVSTGAVAFGVLALLPVELILNVGSGAGFAMVFALLISAIIWNAGTWYMGLPASSSHTLIGSILGVGLMNSLMSSQRQFGDGVNWGKTYEVGMSLLISPLIGFAAAGLLLIVAKVLIHRAELYEAPSANTPPPLWIRALLMLTCTGVSFAHGSNDGQKGMGLIMLILIGVVPASFAVDLSASSDTLHHVVDGTNRVGAILDTTGKTQLAYNGDPGDTLSAYLRTGKPDDATIAAVAMANRDIRSRLSGVDSLSKLDGEGRRALRSDLYLVSESLNKLVKTDVFSAADKPALMDYRKLLVSLTNFIPTWVKVAVALALGLGTMIGWKRIVVTVGEKIGKTHLSYGQGAAAELVAMATIGAADGLGLPVSTTHVLSSGIAGTMAANRSGLQGGTLRNVILAWVLTLPVSVFLGALFFAAGLELVFHVFGGS